MVDRLGMHTYTRSIGAAFGVLVVSGAAGGVAGVRVLDYGEPLMSGTFSMSDDGSTIYVGDVYSEHQTLRVDRGFGLEVIEDSGSGWFTGDVSNDGSRLLLFSLGPVQHDTYFDGVFGSLPEVELGGVVYPGVSLYPSQLSGDGSTIGMIGRIDGEVTALLYRDGVYEDLGFVAPGALSLYSMDGMSDDGAATLFSARSSGSQGASPYAQESYIWVRRDSGWTAIGGIDLGTEIQRHQGGDISGDGSTVIGYSYAIEETDDIPGHRSGPEQGWVWRDGVTTALNDGSFYSVWVGDVSYDGETLLVSTFDGVETSRNWLWTFDDGFIDLLEYFAANGIEEDLDGVRFESMSDDATVFLGHRYDEVFGFTSYIVTIPSPGGVLALLGGLLMLPARRRARG